MSKCHSCHVHTLLQTRQWLEAGKSRACTACKLLREGRIHDNDDVQALGPVDRAAIHAVGWVFARRAATLLKEDIRYVNEACALEYDTILWSYKAIDDTAQTPQPASKRLCLNANACKQSTSLVPILIKFLNHRNRCIDYITQNQFDEEPCDEDVLRDYSSQVGRIRLDDYHEVCPSEQNAIQKEPLNSSRHNYGCGSQLTQQNFSLYTENVMIHISMVVYWY